MSLCELLDVVAFAFAVVAGASGIVISRYDSSHPARTSPGVPRIWGWNPEGCCSSRIIWPDSIIDPAPATFISASAVFGLATLSFHHHHRDDRYQDRSLYTGIACALIAAFTVPAHAPPLSNFQAYVPFAIIISLLASALIHRWIPSLRDSQAKQRRGNNDDVKRGDEESVQTWSTDEKITIEQ
ncbi:hypothetical protein MMC24_007501 [Lignoscripta atroalba]|nr:hypothetical protein [Lignoscripta atroalba]